jgi:uncharacterized protein
MTRTPAGSPSGPDGGVPEEPAHDPEVVQLAGRAFDLARRGATDTLAAYVDAGVPADLCDEQGATLLLTAVRHGRTGTAAALLERGADPDRADGHGRTALADAVLRGDEEALELLLGAGADPAAGAPSAVQTARGRGLLELAARLEAR